MKFAGRSEEASQRGTASRERAGARAAPSFGALPAGALRVRLGAASHAHGRAADASARRSASYRTAGPARAGARIGRVLGRGRSGGCSVSSRASPSAVPSVDGAISGDARARRVRGTRRSSCLMQRLAARGAPRAGQLWRADGRAHRATARLRPARELARLGELTPRRSRRSPESSPRGSFRRTVDPNPRRLRHGSRATWLSRLDARRGRISALRADSRHAAAIAPLDRGADQLVVVLRDEAVHARSRKKRMIGLKAW